MSNQSEIISNIEAYLGTSGATYNETIVAFCQDQGATSGQYNEALIEFLQSALSSSITNLNGLLTEYSNTYFDGNINSINDFTMHIPGNYVFQDGNDFIFQDGNNYVF